MTTSRNSAAGSTDEACGYWPDASLFGVAVIWGVNIPIMKIGLDQLDPFVFNAIRLTISAAVLITFAVRERHRGIRIDPRLPWTSVAIYAIVVSGLYQLLFLLGVARTTSGNAALIIATIPMWTALLARVFLNEKLRRLAWFGLFVALTGTVIVAMQKGDVSVAQQHLTGNLSVLTAALAWSVGTVYSRPVLKLISPMQLSAYAALLALPLHLMFAWGRYSASLPVLGSANLWLIILYSGALSTGLAMPMWNFGVRHAGAAHAAIIQNLIPVIAAAVAWLSRGESVTGAQLIGGALIISGLMIMRTRRETHAERKNG